MIILIIQFERDFKRLECSIRRINILSYSFYSIKGYSLALL